MQSHEAVGLPEPTEVEEIIDEITETNEIPDRIPDWVKHIFVWYSQGLVDDEQLIEIIQYLISEEIVQVS